MEDTQLKNLQKLFNEKTSTITQRMRDALDANGIQNRSGRLRNSLKNIKVVFKNGEMTIKGTFPGYAKYIDGFGYTKWTTKEGRTSKIPTHFIDPLRELVSDKELKEMAKAITEDIVLSIREEKKKHKNIK